MASVAYPRPWNSGEMVYPTLITFGSPSATANPTSPTIPPPSRSSTVNWTQPPGSPGIRVLISTMSARTPAGSVRSHPCCRFTSGSLRYAEIVWASSGLERRSRRRSVSSGSNSVSTPPAAACRSSPAAPGQDRRQLRGVDASSRHDGDDLARTREPRGCGRDRDRSRTFAHHMRPGRTQADGIRGRVRLDDERPVEQRARQLEHLREDPRGTDPVAEGGRKRTPARPTGGGE